MNGNTLPLRKRIWNALKSRWITNIEFWKGAAILFSLVFTFVIFPIGSWIINRVETNVLLKQKPFMAFLAASYYVQSNSFDDAIIEYRDVVQLRQGKIDDTLLVMALPQYMRALAQSDYPDKSRKDFDTLMGLYKTMRKDSEFEQNAGWYLLRVGNNIEEAKNYFDSCIETSRRYKNKHTEANCYAYRSFYHLVKDATNEAKSDFEAAMDSNPFEFNVSYIDYIEATIYGRDRPLWVQDIAARNPRFESNFAEFMQKLTSGTSFVSTICSEFSAAVNIEGEGNETIIKGNACKWSDGEWHVGMQNTRQPIPTRALLMNAR